MLLPAIAEGADSSSEALRGAWSAYAAAREHELDVEGRAFPGAGGRDAAPAARVPGTACDVWQVIDDDAVTALEAAASAREAAAMSLGRVFREA